MFNNQLSSNNLLIFISSSIICISFSKLFKNINDKTNRELNNINLEYSNTLNSLFKSTKTISRHNEEKFQSRKKYFQKVFNDSNLNNTKIIHVAGSKGKGSTSEFIASAIRSNGYKVGVFTSPHLHTARERIKIGKKLISKEDIIRLGNEALLKMSNYEWSVFFDYFLYIAIKYFGEQSVDYIVLEAGIGGRYDSTNFLDNPDVSIITSISIDHQAILGNTVEEIAWQKAGIIHNKSQVFTPLTQIPSVLSIFNEECKEKNAILHKIPISM
jgi:folylpolyglutamate synthase/dihydrofolate synthase